MTYHVLQVAKTCGNLTRRAPEAWRPPLLRPLNDVTSFLMLALAPPRLVEAFWLLPAAPTASTAPGGSTLLVTADSCAAARPLLPGA